MTTTAAERLLRETQRREALNKSRLLHDYFFGRIGNEGKEVKTTQPRGHAEAKRRGETQG